MYSFTFLASARRPVTDGSLRAAAAVGSQVMPVVPGMSLTSTVTALDGWCGWFSLVPAAPARSDLISEAVRPEVAVVAFGDLQASAGGAPAASVADAWTTGGRAAVQRLGGSFSAVVVERSARRIHLLGDAVGCRALRYSAADDDIVTSPHDLLLLTTGLRRASFDVISAASVAAAEFSLNGASLLDGVEKCHPAEAVTWCDGTLRRERTPIVEAEERLDPRDRRGIAEHQDLMVETARAGAAWAVSQAPTLTTDITSGIDSRSLLGLLLSVTDPARLVASCSGDPEANRDVRVGSRIAGLYGIPFRNVTIGEPVADRFLDHADLLAFAMNGETSSKRAIWAMPGPPRNEPTMHAFGGGGELIRGNYYRGVRRYRTAPPMSFDAAYQTLTKELRVGVVPWADPDVREAVLGRLRGSIDRLGVSDGYDVLDRFFLHEFFANWGAMTARFTWNEPIWSPYVDPGLNRMAHRMPAPIGKHAAIQYIVIPRYARRTYWIPVNGWMLLPTERPGIPGAAGKAFNGARRLRNRLRLGRRPTHASLDVDHGRLLSGPLASTILDVVLEDGSLTGRLFGSNGVERMLQEEREGVRSHVDTLGNLVSVERFRRMAETTVRAADQSDVAQR